MYQPEWTPTPHYRFGHSNMVHADVVFSQSNGRDGRSMCVWMVPGTYDADADMPVPTISTMLGHPFDVTNWRIKLDDQFYSAGELREIASIMDDVRTERNR